MELSVNQKLQISVVPAIDDSSEPHLRSSPSVDQVPVPNVWYTVIDRFDNEFYVQLDERVQRFVLYSDTNMVWYYRSHHGLMNPSPRRFIPQQVNITVA